jgi:hypothetical protein
MTVKHVQKKVWLLQQQVTMIQPATQVGQRMSITCSKVIGDNMNTFTCSATRHVQKSWLKCYNAHVIQAHRNVKQHKKKWDMAQKRKWGSSCFDNIHGSGQIS